MSVSGAIFFVVDLRCEKYTNYLKHVIISIVLFTCRQVKFLVIPNGFHESLEKYNFQRL